MSARFIISKKKTIEQYNKLREISDFVSYSVKTNFEIAKILIDNTDSMFSIHFWNLLSLIPDKSRVWFFAQGWDENFIQQVINEGVKSFIIDNEEDLETLLQYLHHMPCSINLLLRMKLKEHSIHTGKHYVFGMYSDEINKWIPKLRKNNNINRLGIHFHRKTQNTNEWSLIEEFNESTTEETRKAIDIVNIGGGIPVRYRNYSLDLTKGIFDKIKKFKNYLNERDIKMVIEPGRFIAAPPTILETKIKQVIGKTLIVDASVFNAAMDTFIADTRLLVEDELEKASFDKMYTIKGCTPDSRDILRYKVYLDNPKKGQKIKFLNAGAYNFSTDFCKLEKPKTIIVEDW